MWIQALAPLVVVAAFGLLLRGVYLGRSSRDPVRPVTGRAVLWMAFWLALIPSLLLIVVPIYSGVSEVMVTRDGGSVSTSGRATFLEINGLWSILLLAVPVVITSAGLAAGASSHRRFVVWGGAALLTLFVFLGAWTIGLAYLPSAAGLWIAAFATPAST